MKTVLRNARGFSLVEMLLIVGLLGLLAAIAMPMLHSTRMTMSLRSGTEEVSSLLSRSRWMAVTSGSVRVVASPSPSTLEIRTGDGTPLSSLDLAPYGATVSVPEGGIQFDSRGFLSPLATVTVTVTSSTGETKTVTVTPLGRVGQS